MAALKKLVLLRNVYRVICALFRGTQISYLKIFAALFFAIAIAIYFTFLFPPFSLLHRANIISPFSVHVIFPRVKLQVREKSLKNISNHAEM